MSRAHKPKRTDVTDPRDYKSVIVPAFLDYPDAIEQVTEDVRAAVVRREAARAEMTAAAQAHEKAINADRIAAAHNPDGTVEKTEPELRERKRRAQEDEQRAVDALSVAIKKQSRAITPDVATAWRAQHQPQVIDMNAEIREDLAKLTEKIARRDQMIELDRALERIENGEPYRLDVAAPGRAERQVRSRRDKMIELFLQGNRPLTVPNDVPHLLAALVVDAERWELEQQHGRHHQRRGEIVAEVKRLNLPLSKRNAEILRRFDAEGIPRPHTLAA